jgi:hypothetical protein
MSLHTLRALKSKYLVFQASRKFDISQCEDIFEIIMKMIHGIFCINHSPCQYDGKCFKTMPKDY